MENHHAINGDSSTISTEATLLNGDLADHQGSWWGHPPSAIRWPGGDP